MLYVMFWKTFQGYEEFCPDWTYSENVGESAKEYVGTAAEEVGFKIVDSTLQDVTFTADSFNLHSSKPIAQFARSQEPTYLPTSFSERTIMFCD